MTYIWIHLQLNIHHIKQEGKPSVFTTDFYFTNKLPSNIAVWTQGANNNTPNADQAEAADPTLFDTDLIQPQERFNYICGCYIHHRHLSWT